MEEESVKRVKTEDTIFAFLLACLSVYKSNKGNIHLLLLLQLVLPGLTSFSSSLRVLRERGYNQELNHAPTLESQKSPPLSVSLFSLLNLSTNTHSLSASNPRREQGQPC